MAIGCYNGITFETSDAKILTIANLAGTSGSDWATHDTVLGKARSQYLGPKLQKYTFEIKLSALHGVPPRRNLRKLKALAEGKTISYLVIGNCPVGNKPFRLTDISDSWDAVLNDGALTECKVSLTLEEYR